MIDTVDALVSPTLKHLREQWWDDEFTEFLVETLKPRPGNRILDVGCGEGLAEVAIGRQHVSQTRLHGVDLVPAKVAAARAATASHNQRARFCAGDAARLPFAAGSFDSTFCVAVLQYLRDAGAALDEIARVTAPGGRIVVVEPDNSARYAFSSIAAGRRAFDAAARFFAALADATAAVADPAIGPKVPALVAEAGVDVLDVRLFPISHVQLGMPETGFWTTRFARIDQLVVASPTPEVRRLAVTYRDALDHYREEAEKAGATFVEIQHTTLFATVGQKQD